MIQSDHALTFAFGLTAGIAIYSILRSIVDLSKNICSQSTPNLSSKEQSDKVTEALRDLVIPRETLLRVTKQMVIEMKRGLSADGQTLKMIPSYVTKRPTGNEAGAFLALDLGGMNNYVLLVRIKLSCM
jgi:hexokinase